MAQTDSVLVLEVVPDYFNSVLPIIICAVTHHHHYIPPLDELE